MSHAQAGPPAMPASHLSAIVRHLQPALPNTACLKMAACSIPSDPACQPILYINSGGLVSADRGRREAITGFQGDRHIKVPRLFNVDVPQQRDGTNLVLGRASQ